MGDATATARTGEQLARVGDIEIAYDTFGDPANPALLLVMGLGMQLIAWDPQFCGMLAERGFHVIRFDNRDVGHSTKIRGGPRPNVAAAFVGLTGSASYTLVDMAQDTAGLLDHLEIEAAHVVGASMGGMIGQTLAIRHPERVRSLASIMSTTGSRRVGQARLKALGAVLRRPPEDRSGYLEDAVRLFKLIGSPGYPPDDQRVRKLAADGYDRCFYRIGIARQIVAIAASGNRTAALRRVDVPTVVIHGDSDVLVPLSGGRATARAIPGAKLVVIPGMGHDLPPEIWPRVVDEVVANAQRATAAATR
jgi:pimeloyl-ACP methyl ester carboxylesterase